MSKDLGLSVVAGLAAALVFLSVLTGGVIGVVLAYFLPLPLVMVGLSWGFGRALLAGGLGLVVVALAASAASGVFVATTLLPALLLVGMARLCRISEGRGVEWFSPGSILAWLAVAAVGLMVLGTLLVTSGGAGLEDEARRTVTQFLDQIAPLAPADVKDGAIALWSALFPAMLGSAWLLMAVLNGVVAQWIVAKAGHAVRPTPVFTLLELPLWTLAALASAVVLGLTAGGNVGYLGRNAAVVLMWPQVFAGLAVVHRTLRSRPNARLMLALFYVVFFVLFRWAVLAVAGFGLVRHWTRLRRRDVESSQEEK